MTEYTHTHTHTHTSVIPRVYVIRCLLQKKKKKRTVKTKNMDEMMHEMNTSMSPLKEET